MTSNNTEKERERERETEREKERKTSKVSEQEDHTSPDIQPQLNCSMAAAAFDKYLCLNLMMLSHFFIIFLRFLQATV